MDNRAAKCHMPVSTQLLMKLMSLDGTTQFAFVTEVGCQQCECCKGHICPSRVTTSCTTSLVASPGHATSPIVTARQNWENGLFQKPHAIPHLEPPYLQAGQEELHVLQEYGFHFPGFLQCFMVILSACLLLNLQDCFLSILRMSPSDLPCTVNCVGNPHWGRLIAMAQLYFRPMKSSN